MERKMKDSGVEWIGQIPEEWEIVNIGRLFNVKAGGDAKPDMYSDIQDMEHPFPVYTNSNDKEKVYAYTSTPYFKKNTITVTGRGEIGRAFFRNVEYDAIIRLLVLQPKIDMDARFYTYWIDKVIVFFTNSAAIGQLSAQQILPYKIPILDIEEQRRIADFLDDKVGEIDTIILKTKASIEEYKKYKNAVVAEVVTKGLDKTVTMKESGIEWVGKIPSHWEVHTLSQVFMQLKNKNSDLSETNLLSLSYGKIKRKDINSSDGLLPESFDGYNVIDKNDIVLRLTDLQNDHKSLRVGHVKERGIITSAYVTLRCKEEMATDYYYYFLHTFDIFKGFYGMGAGVRQGLNYEGIRSMKILSPDIEEQQEIVEYLNAKCTEIDALIAKKEAFVEEMEAYKKSLIYEYVTGKKEVL